MVEISIESPSKAEKFEETTGFHTTPHGINIITCKLEYFRTTDSFLNLIQMFNFFLGAKSILEYYKMFRPRS